MRFALAVCAIFKDEAAYLREWLDFHLLMGVEHFYLYDNGSTDQSLEAVAAYVARGQVTLYAWPRRPGQLEAYNHCVFTHRQDCDWLACIDIDEFLFSPLKLPLPEVLARYAGQPGVGVNWVMFGSSGHREKPDGGVLVNYRRRGALDVEVPYPALRKPGGQGYRPENSHIKSIVRPECVQQFSNPHFAHYAENRQAVSERRESLTGPFSDMVSVDVLRINHYWSKSEQEARRKFARGFADGQGERKWAEFAMHEQAHNSTADDTILTVTVAMAQAATPLPLDQWSLATDGIWHKPGTDDVSICLAEEQPAVDSPEQDVAAWTAMLALSGFEPSADARVLMLGAHHPALAQTWAADGCQVDILEADLATARDAQRRLGPQPALRVFHARLAEVAAVGAYDAILLVGMPRYAGTLAMDALGLAGVLQRSCGLLLEGGVAIMLLPNALSMDKAAVAGDIRQYGTGTLRTHFGRREMRAAATRAGLAMTAGYAIFLDPQGHPELAMHEQAFDLDAQRVYGVIGATEHAAAMDHRHYLQLDGLCHESAMAGLADAYLLAARRTAGAASEGVVKVLWRQLLAARWPALRRIIDGQWNEDATGMWLCSSRMFPDRDLPVLLGQAIQADFSSRRIAHTGASLLVDLRHAAACRRLDRVQGLLREWMALIRQALDSKGKLPGHWLDALPARIYRDVDQAWAFQGGQWNYRDPIEPDLVFYLGFWSLADDPLLAGLVKGEDRIKRMLRLCSESGLVPTEKWLAVTHQIHGLLSPQAPRSEGDAKPDFKSYLQTSGPRPALSYQDQLQLRALSEDMRSRAHVLVTERCQRLPELIVVVLAFGGTPAQLLITLQGLKLSQYQGPVQLVILSDRGAPVAHDRIHWLTIAEGSWHKPLQQWMQTRNEDWLVFLHAGDRFDPAALLLLAERISAAPELRAVYFDEDHLSGEVCQHPVLKPDFNLDMLRAYPYIGRGLAIQRQSCVELGGLRPAYGEVSVHELLLRIYERDGAAAIGHIPELQYHAGLAFPQWLIQPTILGIWSAVVAAHLTRLKIPHTLQPGPLAGMNRVCYDYPEQPLVSVIIPTRDQQHLLAALLDSLQQTAYARYELLIVDNDSQDPEARRYLDGLAQQDPTRIRVLRYPHAFNYSAMNNLAAGEAQGEYLLLLNNDTAALHPEWLEAMLNHARRPEVGIVGCKLHYPDGRIQHAGVILGLRGIAEHPFIGEPEKAGGYMHRLQVDQNYSAVTAACLMIRKSIYEAVGGLDESAFKVSYNDVDLCLKVVNAGHLIVWTPYARLMHHGSSSQNTLDYQQAQAKRRRFQSERDAMELRWMPHLARDPAYNRNFSLQGKSFELDNSRGASWQPFSQPLLPRIICHPADATGCGHYRVRQPFLSMQREMMAEGLISEQLFMSIALERDQVRSLVLQRQHTEPQRNAMKAYRRLPNTFMVYELDDYMLNLPVKSVHRQQMPRDLHKSLREAVALTDRFVVSTECLAEELGYMHSDIRVVLNRLPVDWWSGLSAARQVGAKPRVGWGGGASHTGDLELIADVVRELANEVEWVFFGMCPDKLKPYIHEFHGGVPIAEYPAKLASLDLDLALAPLEDNLFNACKSQLRLLEYGACGFPVICSDLVTYRGELSVTRVKNRFKDWVGAIRMHINDLDAAAAAGDRLRAEVFREWMLTGEHLQAWRDAWLP